MQQLFKRKPLDTRRPPDTMRRVLGPLDLTLLGVGAIVGTGIFVLSGQVAATHTGPAIVLSFALAGGAALLAGLCYAELACMVPMAGSAYSYAYASLGELMAWIIGWDLLLEYLLAAASVSVGWSAYVTAFLRNSLGLTLPPAWTSAPLTWNVSTHAFAWTGAYLNAPAVAVVLSLAILLALGVQGSARFNAVTVLIKMAVIVLFIIFVAQHVQVAHWQPWRPENTGQFGQFGWSGIFQGTSILFFAYNGFDAVSTAAQEARQPQRDLPIGILASLAIAAVLYMGVALVLTGVVPYPELAVANPVSVGVARAGVLWLQPVVEVGAIAGLTSVMLVNLLCQPRIAFAMAQDGLLPPAFGRLHPHFKTPHLATLCGGALCATAGGLLPIDVLGELMCVGTLFAFMVVSLGVMVLRRQMPEAPRRFKVPGGTFGIPLLSALICASLLCVAQPQTLLRFAAWIAVGLVVYTSYGYRHARHTRGAPQS